LPTKNHAPYPSAFTVKLTSARRRHRADNAPGRDKVTLAPSPQGGYRLLMAHDHAHETHPNIVKRLKRAEGHLRRVIEMFAEGRSCLDLAQQLHAVEKAVGEAKRTLIHDHVDHCLVTAAHGNSKSTVTVVDEFKAISKYL
jgi:DNA-binding FrmR family transcriptional regulator